MQLSDSDRASIKKEYKAAGINLMVSAFGSTEQPVTCKFSLGNRAFPDHMLQQRSTLSRWPTRFPTTLSSTPLMVWMLTLRIFQLGITHQVTSRGSTCCDEALKLSLGPAVPWLISLTKQLRKKLPVGKHLYRMATGAVF
jgi:hypothetical protein